MDENGYASVAITTTISATSRQSIKIHDNFYTIEYSEQRSIPDIEGVDLDQERLLLWDAVNTECDNQVAEIQQMWKDYEDKVKRKISHN